MFYEVVFCAASGQIENCHFLLMSRFSTAIAKIFFEANPFRFEIITR